MKISERNKVYCNYKGHLDHTGSKLLVVISQEKLNVCGASISCHCENQGDNFAHCTVTGDDNGYLI